MRATLECCVCEKEFDVDVPYGKNVTCPHCGATLTTESDENRDGSMFAWVTGVASDEG